MKTINLKYLNDHNACSEQVARFRATFGDVSVPVNTKTVKKAKKAGLEIHWLKTTLSVPARAEYDKVRDAALTEYEKVRDAAWAEYQKGRDAAWAEYKKVREAAWAEYENVTDAAYAKYDKVREAAYAKYEKVANAALIRIWSADGA